jgi:hypothetical protein
MGNPMRKLGLPLLAALAFVGGSAEAVPAAASKPCSSGFVHASLSWGHKCLRAGQFCKLSNREYRSYGFSCPSGRLVQKRAS